MTAEESVAASAASHEAASRKEKEKGKETFPPAPPIEKREKEEKAPLRGVFADANFAVGDVDLVSSLDVFLDDFGAERFLYGDYDRVGTFI